MTSQELGNSFEILTKDFFYSLFQEIGLQINNHWIQKAGMQFGFDVGFEIAVLNDSFFTRSIYIECKNYSKSKLDQSQFHTKLLQFSRCDYRKENSIFIFLSPKADLSKSPQDCNPKQLEDFFSDSFKFKILILTPNSRIRDILSLNEKIFRAVYDNAIFNDPDLDYRKEILDYFSNLFRSKGEVPDFTLTAERKKYLEEAQGEKSREIYVGRTVNPALDSFAYSEQTLLDVLRNNDHILLFGEPGSGKTTELIKAANYFKENIAVLEITPVFLSLSNVGEFNEIEDILPEDWLEHERIVLFLDAWDEFEHRKKLAEKLEAFKQNKANGIKVIISCRTYAYNDELEILNPVKFYLNGFDTVQSFEFLNRKFNVSREIFDKIDHNKFKDILGDPFILNRLGIYYLKNDSFPESVIEIYNEIKDELTSEQTYMYTTCALILELTRKPSFSTDELRTLFGLNLKEVQKLEFLEKSFDRKSIKFKHKNYQEFFAASALSALEIKDIKDFVLIPGTNKTHPSLFNTITFLINIIELDKYDELIGWIADNQPEFLFKTDRSRTKNYIIKVFQDYFRKECLEKSLWIDSGNKSAIKEIAEFGDCEENLDFLLQCIEENRSQIRVINSALHLMSFFTIAGAQKTKIKKLFLNYLKDTAILNSMKAGIIGFITAHEICADDQGYLDELFNIFRSENNKEINRALLLMIRDYPLPDRLFWYIKEEFFRENRLVQGSIPESTNQGNRWLVEEFIAKLTVAEHFIELISYYFVKESKIRVSSTFDAVLVERTHYFGERDKEFIIRFFESTGENLNYFRRDKLLGEMIANSHNLYGAAEYLIKNNKFYPASVHLASAADQKLLLIICGFYKTKLIKPEEMLTFRILLLNYNTKALCAYFDELLQEAGFVFSGRQRPVKENQDQKKMEQTRIQKNFDIYFIKEDLLHEIEEVFTRSSFTDLNRKDIIELEDKWHREHGYGVIPSGLYFLNELSDDGPISLQRVKEILEDDLFRFYHICALLEKNKDSQIKFKASDDQKRRIIEWSEKTSKEIRFDQVIKLVNEKNYIEGPDFFRLETVLKFHELLEFDLSQSFLLNSLEFYEVGNFNKEINFEHLKNSINDEELFNRRIVEDLNNKMLFSYVTERYITYVLNINLSDAMPKIREYLLRLDAGLNFEERLERYFTLTSDLEMLLECIAHAEDTKCWSSIKIMIKNNIRTELCINKALEVLNSENQASFYSFDALLILFQFNRPEAIVQYYKMLERGERNLSFHTAYSVVNYEILEKLFFVIFRKNYRENMFNYSIEFIKSYISNLSQKEEDFLNTQNVLQCIKSRLIKAEHDVEIFYINLLIDISKKSHYNFKSRPLEFAEAFKKAEQLLT